MGTDKPKEVPYALKFIGALAVAIVAGSTALTLLAEVIAPKIGIQTVALAKEEHDEIKKEIKGAEIIRILKRMERNQNACKR